MRPATFLAYDPIRTYENRVVTGVPGSAPDAKELQNWSGIRESNPRLDLGKVAYYHYTNPAHGKLCDVFIYSMGITREQELGPRVLTQLLRGLPCSPKHISYRGVWRCRMSAGAKALCFRRS